MVFPTVTFAIFFAIVFPVSWALMERRDAWKAFILAASYDAKRLGLKLGTSVREARQICPEFIVLAPDPPKYREAHRRFKEVLTR